MGEISKTADKALAVLKELGEGEPLTPQQLSSRLGENRTVVQRLLSTLLTRGFVRRDRGTYSLSPRMHELADAVMPSLRAAVAPRVSALSAKVGETVVFQIPDGDEAVVLQQSIPTAGVALQVRHDIGSRSPLGQTASGLAILAAISDARVDSLLGTASYDAVRVRIEGIRETGFALSSGELQAGVSGMAMAVHRGDKVAGSLAILVPCIREDGLATYEVPLFQAARDIEAVLGD